MEQYPGETKTQDPCCHHLAISEDKRNHTGEPNILKHALRISKVKPTTASLEMESE